MTQKNPIKFLDSYTKDDQDIFFGREKETTALFEKVNQAKVVLLYGLSGTGKTSLIHAGLENRYPEGRFRFLYIRRGRHIINSIRTVAEEYADSMIHPKASPREALETLYFDYLTPLIVVFDQFEELFISGSHAEKEEFIDSIADMLQSNIKVKFIFSLREEYLAHLDEFEEKIPAFFDYRLRIEKMRRTTLEDVITKIAGKAGILIENENIPGKIIDNISDRKGYVELPYLQVYLDKLMRLSESSGSKAHFTTALVEQAGQLEDVLGDFLDEQVNTISPKVNNRKFVEDILKQMITPEGTKRQLSFDDFKLKSEEEKSNLIIVLEALEQSRIIKLEDGIYELSHDSLARKIAEKRSSEELQLVEVILFIKNAYTVFKKTQTLLDDKQLEYVNPYLSRIQLEEAEKQFVEQSKEQVIKELVKNRNKKRNRIITTVAFVALIVLPIYLVYMVMLAKTEKAKAVALMSQAKAEQVLAEAQRDSAKIVMRQAVEQRYQAQRDQMLADSGARAAHYQSMMAQKESEMAKRQAQMAQQESMMAKQQEKRATMQMREAEILKDSAVNRLALANKFINQFYFYDDRLTLGFKEGKFGFLNKQGDAVIDFTYKNAENFDQFTGLAKVSNDEGTFLLNANGDPIQKEYPLASGISELNPNILALDLSNQRFEEIPAEVFENTQLEILILNRTGVKVLSNDIRKLIHLKILDLGGLELTSLPEEIGNLTELETLDLSWVQINQLPKWVGNLQQLKFLTLFYTLIQELPQEIGSLTNLKKLDLNSTPITTLPPEIGELKNLEILDVSFSYIESLPPQIGMLKNLRTLELSGSGNITNLPNEIGLMTNLKELYLTSTQISNLPTEIGKLTNLYVLDLGFTNVDSLPAEIGNLRNLNELVLINTKISGLPEDIGNLRKLRFLSLPKYYFPYEDVEKIQSMLPDCEVEIL